MTKGAQKVLCANLEGWNGVGGSKRRGIYIYLWLFHVVVWEKPTQHYKAIILQLKVKKKKKRPNEPELCETLWLTSRL